jgi:hypothetical protein
MLAINENPHFNTLGTDDYGPLAHLCARSPAAWSLVFQRPCGFALRLTGVELRPTIFAPEVPFQIRPGEARRGSSR